MSNVRADVVSVLCRGLSTHQHIWKCPSTQASKEWSAEQGAAGKNSRKTTARCMQLNLASLCCRGTRNLKEMKVPTTRRHPHRDSDVASTNIGGTVQLLGWLFLRKTRTFEAPFNDVCFHLFSCTHNKGYSSEKVDGTAFVVVLAKQHLLQKMVAIDLPCVRNKNNTSVYWLQDRRRGQRSHAIVESHILGLLLWPRPSCCVGWWVYRHFKASWFLCFFWDKEGQLELTCRVCAEQGCLFWLLPSFNINILCCRCFCRKHIVK